MLYEISHEVGGKWIPYATKSFATEADRAAYHGNLPADDGPYAFHAVINRRAKIMHRVRGIVGRRPFVTGAASGVAVSFPLWEILHIVGLL